MPESLYQRTRFGQCGRALSQTAALCLVGLAMVAGPAERVSAAEAEFNRDVDLERFRLVALQNEGRFKTFDTMAREMVREITGSAFYKRETAGGVIVQDPVFTYLDLTFNPKAYRQLRVIYVKKKPIRDALVRAAGDSLDATTRNQIYADGLVSLSFLQMPPVRAKLVELSSDVMRGAKDVEMLATAANLTNAEALMDTMRIVPPPGTTDARARWYPVSSLASLPQDSAHADLMDSAVRIRGMDPTLQARLSSLWSAAGKAWEAGDGAKASENLNALADELRGLSPTIYPPHRKLALEHWYYKTYKMTWTWIAYMFAAVFLLMGIVERWPRARKVGIGLFVVAFGLHTVASGIRWYLAGRIPNSNMFEATTAAAWFGCVFAVFFEMGPRLVKRPSLWKVSWGLLIGGFIVFVAGLLVRGVPFHEFQQWGPIPTVGLITLALGTMTLVSMSSAQRFTPNCLPLLGACVAGMVAMMCGYFMPVTLTTDIENRMPVLNDVWLYIHTNMIIASYALIAIAYVTSAMYVVGRLLANPSAVLWGTMLIPALVIPIVGLIPGIGFLMILPAWLPFAIVIAAYGVCRLIRLIGGRRVAARSNAAWIGEGLPDLPAGPAAAALLLGGVPMLALDTGARFAKAGGSSGSREPKPPRRKDDGILRGLAEVLDGATMLLFELFFIILWTGIIMGAIWADHSWGRPWGWDPKEVFALNTWIIFLILVHVRIKVQDKALWTAVLGVVGCSVMLFNWIVVNFFITGLHSYA